ncbi:MAG: bifunctional diaminohydroxyphosphoribosylaminopyrimidine deaminase/5-amino-6-(5-phosphoribosylamino)uracil reductase RibD [Candidatus Cloacimonas sp.]
MGYEEKFFRMAFELAERGRGKCEPNPFVGALIVKNGRVIGSGYTQPYGKNHAEKEAILNATENTKGADLYVTLEPCVHYGKTPPCAEAIIEAGIKNVYAGIQDPNPLVNGKGFEHLRKAGINVETGFMQEEIEKQLECYLHYKKTERPFFIMKGGVSLDGKIATNKGESKWITSEKSRLRGQMLRREAGALITGIGTLLEDNPRLNIRLEGGIKPLIRIVLDSQLRIPADSNVANNADKNPTYVIKSVEHSDPKKEEALSAKGINIRSAPIGTDGRIELQAVIPILNELKIQTVLIEAGPKLCSAFLDAQLVDKLYYFVAPKIIGGHNSLFQYLDIQNLNEAVNLKIESIERIDEDLLIVCYPIYNRHF